MIVVSGILLFSLIQAVTQHFNLLGRWSAVGLFGVIWCTVTTFNMWFGIEHAGYSFLEELPIFLVNMMVPLGLGMAWMWAKK